LTILSNWNTISTEEASKILFKLCYDLFLKDQGYMIAANANVRLLTQRLYGDYRQIHQTSEFRRAERQHRFFRTTGLGKELW
jgi:hypothetical protein